MLTLWDLLRGRGAGSADAGREPGGRSRRATPGRAARRTARGSAGMKGRYAAMERAALAEHGVRVRRWRSSMTGIAWQVTYRDGTVSRLIEAPRPRGPMSAAVFLHEVGHHAIGFNRYRPRCLEEYHAWAWSLAAMERHGLNVTEAVRRRMHESLHYAVAKAARRGLKRLPAELEAFVVAPEPRRRRG